MKLYLYDFDGTIYDGDSSVDFFKFCLKKDKKLIFHLIKIIPKLIQYKLKKITITELKSFVFSYYCLLPGRPIQISVSILFPWVAIEN